MTRWVPVIAANEGDQVPMRDLATMGHLSDVDEEQADWDDIDDELDPCNHCPHDLTRHRGDGCLDCGCDVPA